MLLISLALIILRTYCDVFQKTCVWGSVQQQPTRNFVGNRNVEAYARGKEHSLDTDLLPAVTDTEQEQEGQKQVFSSRYTRSCLSDTSEKQVPSRGKRDRERPKTLKRQREEKRVRKRRHTRSSRQDTGQIRSRVPDMELVLEVQVQVSQSSLKHIQEETVSYCNILRF
jgi:hypothetical protein